MNISDKIKNIRLMNRMTQENFAKELGISRYSLGYYEKGLRKIPAEVLLKISEKFDVKLEEFKQDEKKSLYTLNHEEAMTLKESGIAEEYSDNDKKSDEVILESFKNYLLDNGCPVNSMNDKEIKELHKKVSEYIDFELFKKGYIKIS